MTATQFSKNHTDKDVQRILRCSEPEIILIIRKLYDTNCSYAGVKDMLRQHSVNDEKFNRLYKYLVDENLIETTSVDLHGPLRLTRKSKDVLKARFDRAFP